MNLTCKCKIGLLVILMIVAAIAAVSLCRETNFANAETDYTPVVTVENKTVHRGQAFELNVDLSGNEGLISMLLTLDYDDTAMKLTNIRKGSALDSMTFTVSNVEGEWGYDIKPLNMLWDGRNQDVSNGTIVTFVFESYSTAEIGDYPVTLTFDKGNTNSAYQTPIDIEIVNGVVTLIKGEFSAKYRDWDGTILFEKDYNADDIPAYVGDEPYREPTPEYTYKFTGWAAGLSDDINVILYDAVYEATPRAYTLFYYIDGFTDEPDGNIDANDFMTAKELNYGTFIDSVTVPFKTDYEFVGWFLDSSFTQPFGYAMMPAENLRLYGYYKFDIRDSSLPKITLNTTYIGNTQAVVKASMIRNTGLNAMILTLVYDHSNMILTGFDRLDGALSKMQFDTTNEEKLNEEGFKFYFEYSENNYDTGDFLVLYFDFVNGIKDGVYEVGFTYDYHSDATYINSKREIKYTMLEFVNAEVPIGTINHWNQPVDQERAIDVTSEDGKPINVRMAVELVTEQVDLEPEKINADVGENMTLSSAYTVKLLQNGDEILPETQLTIKIKLTDAEKKGKNLKFYTMNAEGELVDTPYRIDNGYLVFKTDTLDTWLLFYELNKFASPGRVVTLIGMPILLAVVTMLYAIVLMTRKKSNVKHNKGDAQ